MPQADDPISFVHSKMTLADQALQQTPSGSAPCLQELTELLQRGLGV